MRPGPRPALPSRQSADLGVKVNVSTAPRTLIIVAAKDARQTIGPCLAAIERQLTSRDALLVVDGSRDGTGALVQREFPAARLLTSRWDALVPQLWSQGLTATAAEGWEVAVLTTAHCVPEEGWLVRLLAALADEGMAVAGGAIEPAAGLSATDWAIYLQRYSGVDRSRPQGDVSDVAADNAVYRLRALDGVHDAISPITATGFWEPFVHEALRQQGWRLTFAPDAVVRYHGSTRIGTFCVQRFRHGRYFGAWRTRRASWGIRAIRVLAAPVVPALMIRRVAAHVRRSGRYGRELSRAVPLLVLFLFAWAIGEVVGVLLGVPGASGRDRVDRSH